MASGLHSAQGVGEVHIPYNWSYADSTARLAASGFVAAEVGKLARQLDDNSLWMLTDESPVTWQDCAKPMSPVVVTLHSDPNPYIEVDSAISWVEVARFVFPGTGATGDPSSIKFLLECTLATYTAYARVYDVTNSQVIASVSTTSNSMTIVSDSTLQNLPAGEAIWAIQLKDSAGTFPDNPKVRSSGLSVCFG